jgi:3-oxoacyl-[acyl-carrier protein] reductase
MSGPGPGADGAATPSSGYDHGARVLDRFRLDGRRAIVTGGGSGLGREFVLALAEAGAEVVVADIDAEAAAETVALVAARGGRALPVSVDVADAASVEAFGTALRAMDGPVHVLVNNAGISTPSRRLHEIAVEDWDRVIAIDLRSVFLVSRAVLPLMMGTGSGAVVNIASIVGVEGLDPGILAQSGYVAAKAGVIGLTRQMAVEYGRDGIRVNAIAPGWHLGTRLGERVGNFRTDADMARLVSFIRGHTPLDRHTP